MDFRSRNDAIKLNESSIRLIFMVRDFASFVVKQSCTNFILNGPLVPDISSGAAMFSL